ncbi:MAG: glycoside hydrolase family 127 protein [Bacteroidales bacterium]|jgi:DUF1680 family protein|nr:glycoside hydrolase family 127 protein [Bacteroidales bacterium]
MQRLILVILLFPAVIFSRGQGYPIRQVPFTAVEVTDNFWRPRIKTNHEVTIPIAFGYCETTGRIKNFEVAGGLTEGTFCTMYPFDDSDVFKIVEGASYSLQTFPDPELEDYLDTLIYKFVMAQEDDGYLYTNRTILGGSGHEWIGTERWQNTHLHSHELYNMGHMFEAAVAHYRATGKRNFLDVAIKAADRIDEDFGWDAKVSYPGHQGIEIGLVKLYNVTGEKRYLDLAKFFLDARKDGPEYCQAHLPVTEQEEAVGHAVRATYMYSGMADVAALTGEQDYIDAISRIWEDITYRKIYVTGGIGASGGNEGFAEPYYLPNATAYCETCASIGNIFFNHRLFLLHGDAKYYDVLERTLYNAMLSGVSLSGDRFFYPNVLESDGSHERQAWFGCACCPSNICRFIPSVPGYVYAVDKDGIYVNLYMSNHANIEYEKETVSLTQETYYPYDGKIKITIGLEETKTFVLRLRIPGWARGEAIDGDLYVFRDRHEPEWKVMVNGDSINCTIEKGYLIIDRHWQDGDEVVLDLSMHVRQVAADERVKADSARMAFQRGPLVYAAEWPDNPGTDVLKVKVNPTSVSGCEEKSYMLVEAQTIRLCGDCGEQPLVFIPYHLWNNRGPGPMQVWIPLVDLPDQ